MKLFIFVSAILIGAISFYEISANSPSELPDFSVEAPTSPLKSVSDMFNERGYYKSNGFSFDEQEIINDFNGNLMYSFPLYSFAPGGNLNFNMKMNYNGSVSHALLVSSVHKQNQAGQNRFNNRYTMNFPEWILEINGFAVQIFNFETNFFDSTTTDEIEGSDINAIIPGYHHDNELRAVSVDNHDVINIMAGDGSLISLQNKIYDDVNLDNSYIGEYFYKGKELHYKALVKYKPNASGYIGYKERQMILLTGDGNEYYFEEKKKNFQDYRTNNIVNARINPMMMYLKEIRDRFGGILKINYTSIVPFSISNSEEIMGRDLFKSVTFSGISSSINGFGITAEYGQGGVKLFHDSQLNGNYTLYFQKPVNYRPFGDYRNQRASISKIINVLNQTTEIEYQNYTRSYSSVYNPFASSSNSLTLNANDLKRIKSFTNNLGLKRDYVYFGDSIKNIDLNTYLAGEDNKKFILSDINTYKGMGRDPYFTNMLLAKYEYQNYLKSTSSFLYHYNYFGRNDFQEVPVSITDFYGSEKTITYNNKPSWDTTDNFRVYREYKIYPLYDSANHFAYSPDNDGTTKLIKEEVQDYDSQQMLKKTETAYETGTFNSTTEGYNGSFLITSKKDSYPGVSQFNEWKWKYTYFGGSYDSLISNKKEISPFNDTLSTDLKYFYVKYRHKKFISDYIYNSGFDTSTFYKTDVVVTEKKSSSSGALLQKKSYTYLEDYYELDTITNSGYYGQLISEKTYKAPSFSEYIETEYLYCKNDTSGRHLFAGTGIFPYKEGNLKQTKVNNQLTKFYYNPIFLSEVYKNTTPTSDLPDGIPMLRYKIKYNNGSLLDTFALIWDFRFPIRTENSEIEDNQEKSLSVVYKSYTLDGSPDRMIDQNKYLTQIVYQPVHRVNSITLPGDFSTSADSIILKIDTHYIYVHSEFNSIGWGNYNTADAKVNYYKGNSFGTLKGCNIFKTDINYSASGNNFHSFVKFSADSIDKFKIIDSAMFDFTAQQFIALYNNNPIPSNYYETYIKAITSISNISSGSCTQSDVASAGLSSYSVSVQLDTHSGSSSCNFYSFKNKYDVKNLLNNLNSNNLDFLGLTISNAYTGPITGADIPKFLLNFTDCQYSAEPNLTEVMPRLNVYGKFDVSDTLKIPVIKGGTIKYVYDDVNKTIEVYSMRNTLTNDGGRIKYHIDQSGSIKQKDIYVSESSFNSYKYKFNYLNHPSVNFDALGDSTRMIYDGLERLTVTINPDTSRTFNSYSYIGSFTNHFGTTAGVTFQQRFTDEEGNFFDKYTDAAGNLRREIKYIQENPNLENLTQLVTDYNYDSLYRVTQVKTPEGKFISYSYDGYGRQSKRTTPDAGQTDYVFDKNNNLTYTQDANQRNVSSYKYTFRNYDGINRLTGIGEKIFEIDAPADGGQFVSSDDDPYLTINVYDTLSSSIVNNLFTAPAGYTSPLFTKGNLAATAYRTRSTDTWNFKYYSYDVRGRVVKMWNIIDNFDTVVTRYDYNSQDQITYLTYQPGQNDFRKYHYEYDYTGRLQNVSYWTEPVEDNPAGYYASFSSYSYNANSQIEQQVYGDAVLANNFSYNNRNWITFVQDSKGVIEYTNSYFKNGNVKTQEFNGNYKANFSNTSILSFDFTYDKSNRLLTMEGNNKGYDIENTYDKDGNLLTLKRYNSSGGLNDNFSYTYYSGTNKLNRVTGSTAQYTYDANGNMTRDDVNRNADIKYDYRNLITQLKHTEYELEDSIITVIYYQYDESGNRIRKTIYNYVGAGSNPDTPPIGDIGGNDDWEQIMDEIYSRGVDGKELAIYQSGNLVQWNVWGSDNIGKINSDGSKHYYLKDHLGSVRAVIDENTDVVSAQDYDAWGFLLEDRTYESSETKHKFTGKERDVESEYDYFGARYYDGRIGRWGQVDPLSYKYIGYSPYCYVVDNPLLFIDRKGAEIDLSRLPQRYRKELINNLSLITGLQLYEDEKGYLKYTIKNGKPKTNDGSKTANKIILDAIELTEVVDVWYTNQGSSAGDYSIKLDAQQIQFYVDNTSSDLNKNTLGWGMVFIHEYLHTTPGGSLSDPKQYGLIGEVEYTMNDIREELGSDYGMRASYQSLLLDDGFRYIPFSTYSEELIQSGKIPSASFVKSLGKEGR